MEATRDNVAQYLLENNIKPSYQRIKVLEYLLDKRNHPTVEQIYHDLVQQIPTISKTTVYNSLYLFMEQGLVRQLNIDDNKTRYDATISSHGHFKCELCGHIADFPLQVDQIEVNGVLKEYKINEKEVYYKGICPNCL